ncbi:MAG: elongation factor G [Candidatus Omnitrophica bacterium]|nr:elongation factor G [Candidatus Omnitrophota bacterium]
MAVFDAKDIRNIVLLGHSGSGKTSLAEALLMSSGAIPKMGSIADKNTVSDYNEDEKEHKCSIGSSLVSFNSDGRKINIIDTPGYIDFIGDMIGGLRAADASIIVVNSTGGVEIGTEKAQRMSCEKGVPSMFFINKLDKDHSDFNKCIESITRKFRKSCVLVAYPAGEKSSFKGVVNLITGQGLDTLADSDKAAAQAAIDTLSEAVAETDDALLEKYLEQGKLSADELKNALKKSIADGTIHPIMCGSSTLNIGVKELLDFMVEYLPSPAERPQTEATRPGSDGAERFAVKLDPNGPFSGFVFKTLSDPFLGQISIFKVFSGKLQSNGGFYNVNRSSRERVGQVFTLLGKQQISMESVHAGDIACVSKLKDTRTGDSICDEKNQVKFEDINFPEPAIAFSLKPKTRSDEDKIGNALHRLTAEDPTFQVTRDEQTKEVIANGMGDLHINMMINRMRMRYGVMVGLGTPKVAYKETITGKGDAQYRHKKQTGGAGQFAEVWMRIEPLERGKGFEFVDEVAGGSIPRPFVISCEKGIKTALQSGSLAGFPVVDVRAIVYDGKTHPVDSKDIAFQTAAKFAFRESLSKAKPVILEPVMDVDIVVPDMFVGDIAGSLNSHRGRVMGMEPGEDVQTVKAKIPLGEMYKYVNELKSITGGRGTYTMTVSHYDVVPSNVAQAIVEKAKLNKKEEVEE